jgi:tetratricopeptide (TPR) repeat protein
LQEQSQQAASLEAVILPPGFAAVLSNELSGFANEARISSLEMNEEGLMYCSLARRIAGVVVVFAAFAFTISAYAQTGGLTGKCTGEDGSPLVGYTIQLDRTDIKWTSHVKTNKHGEYIYIGLTLGDYEIKIINPQGAQVFSGKQHVGLGEPATFDFDMAKEKANVKALNPEYAKKVEEQQKDQKQFVGLKQTFDQGVLLFNQQRYAEAAAMFEQALPLAKTSNTPVVLGRLAASYDKAATQEQSRDARLADQQKAIDTYKKALELSPADAGLHDNLGSAYADAGKIPEAQAEFQKAAELNPTGASGYYYNLGVIMVNQGKMDEAGVALKKAIDLDATNANAFYWYGMALFGKAESKPDGTIVPVPGTIEAFQAYLKLAPTGQWAAAAQASIDQLHAVVPTAYKAQKKKKS